MKPLRVIPTLLALALLVLAGCAKQPGVPAESTIGPYGHFSGRLIVMEPERRWQVIIQWRADNPEQGAVRLTHAATGTVVEFRWFGNDMQLRDSNDRLWKEISPEQLGSHGIVMPPRQLAAILLGKIPPHFLEIKPGLWESRSNGDVIRLQWHASFQKLVMTDIKNGRQATLIISP